MTPRYLPRDWGRVNETDTTDEFVKKQGVVYVICPDHNDGYQYVRYLIIGYIFVDDPEGKHFVSAKNAFPHYKQVIVLAHCPTCLRRAK